MQGGTRVTRSTSTVLSIVTEGKSLSWFHSMNSLSLFPLLSRHFEYSCYFSLCLILFRVSSPGELRFFFLLCNCCAFFFMVSLPSFKTYFSLWTRLSAMPSWFSTVFNTKIYYIPDTNNFLLEKKIKGLDQQGGSVGKGNLLPSLTIWVQPPGPTKWKEQPNPYSAVSRVHHPIYFK